MASYPTAGPSYLPTWNTSQQAVSITPTQLFSQTPIGPQKPSNVLGTTSNDMADAGPGGAYPPNPPPVINKPAPVPAAPQPSQPTMPNNDDINREIESAYGSSMDYLSNAESSLRSALPSYMQDAESLYNSGKSTLDTGKSATLNTINQAGTQAGTLREDALNSARRLYNELMRSGQQRFGGSTSAGQAYTELNSQEQQRRSGDIYKQYQSTVQQLEAKKVDLEGQYQNSLLQLTTQKEQAVNQANRDFQNKLLEINRLRAEAGQNKAQMRLDALQNLRNQVFQIQQQQTQFQQQLEMQRQQSLLELQSAQQSFGQAGMGAQSAFQSFADTNPTNVSTGLQVSQGGSSTFGNPQMTGQVTRRPEEQMIGSIAPSLNRYLDFSNQLAGQPAYAGR